MTAEPGVRPGELREGADAVFDRARHRPLSGAPWDPTAVRDAIAAIVRDFEAARRPDASWPTHPLDHTTPVPRWSAHAGAAGAVTALRILARAGYTREDPSDSLDRIHAAWLERPDHGYETGLQLGEIGILTPAVLADPGDPVRRDGLARAVEGTLGHPAREITSGETGAMHAALALYRATGDARWSDLYARCADSLFRSWFRRPESGEWVWRNEIFGSVRGYYGACHGVAGNAGCFVRGRDLLPALSLETITARAVTTLGIGALREGADINWPVSGDPSGTRRLVQWCHGAPGVVTALACTPRDDGPVSASLDDLLTSAGELVWKAGPLAKGPGLCHGTAGNGYAFLDLYRRTGAPLWLDRARRFAMHAIGQQERAAVRYGQGRYTLWTGDGGLAVYLHHCLHPGEAVFPGLDLF